jgi:hypothetical protein
VPHIFRSPGRTSLEARCNILLRYSIQLSSGSCPNKLPIPVMSASVTKHDSCKIRWTRSDCKNIFKKERLTPMGLFHSVGNLYMYVRSRKWSVMYGACMNTHHTVWQHAISCFKITEYRAVYRTHMKSVSCLLLRETLRAFTRAYCDKIYRYFWRYIKLGF